MHHLTFGRDVQLIVQPIDRDGVSPPFRVLCAAGSGVPGSMRRIALGVRLQPILRCSHRLHYRLRAGASSVRRGLDAEPGIRPGS